LYIHVSLPAIHPLLVPAHNACAQDFIYQKGAAVAAEDIMKARVMKQSQEAVANKYVFHSCFAQGFNATIFAYGQTGAGKTFTMFGPDDYVPYPQVRKAFMFCLTFYCVIVMMTCSHSCGALCREHAHSYSTRSTRALTTALSKRMPVL
jgi:hypothetical protein